jgi:hypothetical protein
MSCVDHDVCGSKTAKHVKVIFGPATGGGAGGGASGARASHSPPRRPHSPPRRRLTTPAPRRRLTTPAPRRRLTTPAPRRRRDPTARHAACTSVDARPQVAELLCAVRAGDCRRRRAAHLANRLEHAAANSRLCNGSCASCWLEDVHRCGRSGATVKGLLGAQWVFLCVNGSKARRVCTARGGWVSRLSCGKHSSWERSGHRLATFNGAVSPLKSSIPRLICGKGALPEGLRRLPFVAEMDAGGVENSGTNVFFNYVCVDTRSDVEGADHRRERRKAATAIPHVRDVRVPAAGLHGS